VSVRSVILQKRPSSWLVDVNPNHDVFSTSRLPVGENPTTGNPPYHITWLQGSRFALPSTFCRKLFPHLQSL
jgi:hypothetical protein